MSDALRYACVYNSGGLWQTFGVGSHYTSYTINRNFRHDGNNAVVWSALSNLGGLISPSCSHNDIVLAS